MFAVYFADCARQFESLGLPKLPPSPKWRSTHAHARPGTRARPGTCARTDTGTHVDAHGSTL